MEELVTLNIYDHYYQASYDQQLLKEEGIYSYIANEYTIQANWLFSQAIGGIRLQVFKKDLKKAHNVLEASLENKTSEELKVEYKIENPECKGVTCPNCGSNHVYRDEKLDGLFALSTIIFAFPMPIKLNSRTFHCYYCGNTWKTKYKIKGFVR